MVDTPNPLGTAAQLDDAQLKRVIEQVRSEGQTPPPQPLEVKLTTGQVYRGSTTQELIDQLTHAQEEASRTLQQYKGEKEALTQQLEEAHRAAPPQTLDNAGKFDSVQYYNLWQQDPLQAQNYLDSFRFGEPFEQVKQRVTHSWEVANEFEQHKAVALFHAKHPEFPGGEEAAEMVLRRLAERQQNISYDNLNTAYLELRYEGKIKPVEGESGATPSVSAPTPPPVLPSGGGGTAPDSTLVEQAENMSTADLEKLLRERGMLK